MQVLSSIVLDDGVVSKSVRIWLWLGVFMLIIQILLGGITRLTGSGLSITKWEIAVGTLPPMNDVQWNASFALYKETPQYHKINKGMSLSEFKFIYFWEYFHRLWARSIGLVFFIPFLVFLSRRMLPKSLIKDLLVIVALGGVVGLFGWIMVASGLVNRPWVNAYKLTLHLNLAFLVYVYLLWTTIKVTWPDRQRLLNIESKGLFMCFGLILILQLLLGGIMYGMKAGLFYPTWPLMGDEWIAAPLKEISNWKLNNFKDYDNHLFVPAFFQFLHRSVGYVLLIMGTIIYFRFIRLKVKVPIIRLSFLMFFIFLMLQVVLGILTLLFSRGYIPLFLGVAHQLGAVLVLSMSVNLFYRNSFRSAQT